MNRALFGLYSENNESMNRKPEASKYPAPLTNKFIKYEIKAMSKNRSTFLYLIFDLQSSVSYSSSENNLIGSK